MRRRLTLTFLVGLALALAGCTGALDAGEELDAADAGNASDEGNEERSPPANATDQAPPSNATDEQPPTNDTAPDEPNGTADGEEGPALGNLTMENAARERPNASTIVFTWTGEAGFSSENASFEVPSAAPFAANATLTWEGEADLGLILHAPEVDAFCRVGRWASYHLTSSDGQATCEVPSLAQPEGTTWTATVERTDAENRDGLEDQAVPFTLTLELRALPEDVAEGGPSLAPDPGTDLGVVGWPALEDAEIRPGVPITGGCTGNFVFATPDNGTLYMGTAAHCIAPTSGPAVHLGDEVEVMGGAYTGRVAYCSWGAVEDLLVCPYKYSSDEGRADDFALIELPAAARDTVHPAVRVWGGPAEVGDPPGQGTQVRTYGNSGLRDAYQDANVGDSRAGVVAEEGDTRTDVVFAPASVWGDSGSPAITADGATVGTVVTLGPGTNGIVNLDASLANFEERTGRSLELATWPLFDVPRYEPTPSPGAP